MKVLATWKARARREEGGLRPVQYILIVLLGLIIWFVVSHAPSMLHQMAVANIAEEQAAKMNVNRNDDQIKKAIIKEAGEEGVRLVEADIVLDRQTEPKIQNVVTIEWDDQVSSIFGDPKTVHHSVTRKAGYGEKLEQ